MSRFISDLAYNPAFPPDWEGLGYESAEESTPRWYGVSSGNGNDGVSHTWPDYYVRTCEPYALATAALLGELKPAYYQAALDAMDVEGEKDYTISATIYNPEDIEPSEGTALNHYTCPDCEHDWEREDTAGYVMTCPACGYEEVEPCDIDSDGYSWCDANGAWLIIEVFPVDAETAEGSRCMTYDSLDDALSADVVRLARDA